MMDMKAISPIDFEKLTQTVLNSMGLLQNLQKKRETEELISLPTINNL